MSIDTRFYPVTEETDWEPLEQLLGVSLDEWMFMEAETNGWRYYKHSATRKLLAARIRDNGMVEWTEEP